MIHIMISCLPVLPAIKIVYSCLLFVLFIIDGYNRYIDEIGGWIGAGPCQHEGQIYYIERNTRFLHFLSDSDEESNDWLYAVIAHIVSIACNSYIHV